MSKRPRKKNGPTATFKSGIHHDIGMDTRQLIAVARHNDAVNSREAFSKAAAAHVISEARRN